MKIKTKGKGYLRDATGKIISKVDLPEGEHEFEDGLTFVEVADRAELDSIPHVEVELSPEFVLEDKIQKELRRIAIENLTARGEI